MDIFFKGGILFMSALTAILCLIVVFTVILINNQFFRKIQNSNKTCQQITKIKSLGLLALVIGLLGQLLGLFSAFKAVKLGEVEASPALLTEGFSISMISAVYGILIFVISLTIGYSIKKFLLKI